MIRFRLLAVPAVPAIPERLDRHGNAVDAISDSAISSNGLLQLRRDRDTCPPPQICEWSSKIRYNDPYQNDLFDESPQLLADFPADNKDRHHTFFVG
jgi:hypothetical protein